MQNIVKIQALSVSFKGFHNICFTFVGHWTNYDGLLAAINISLVKLAVRQLSLGKNKQYCGWKIDIQWLCSLLHLYRPVSRNVNVFILFNNYLYGYG